jgi:NADPH:quinone reductase-like Zn-dependent oxidoreductase
LVWFGVAATRDKGLRVIPLTLLMVFLLKLLPDGKKTPLSPNLAEYAPAHLDWYRDRLAELFELLAENKIEPVVAARFPLAEAARAHEHLERGGYAGKVVLVTGA